MVEWSTTLMTISDFSNHRRRFVTHCAALLVGPSMIFKTQSVSAQSTHNYGIVGESAPEITLDYWIDKDGEPASFSVLENSGKWVFLKCFQNWCPGCHSSGFPTLKKFSDEFWDHPKVAIAGIQTVFEGYSSNTQDAVRELQLHYELPITMGHDPGDPDTRTHPQTMRKYRTGGTPWLILIAPDGQVVFNDYHVNADKLIEYIQAQVG